MLGHGFSEAISYNTVMPGETYSQPMRLSFAPYLFDPRCTRESLCGQYTFEVIANIVDDDVPKGIKSVRFAFTLAARNEIFVLVVIASFRLPSCVVY